MSSSSYSYLSQLKLASDSPACSPIPSSRILGYFHGSLKGSIRGLVCGVQGFGV